MSVSSDLRALRAFGWRDERIAASIGCSSRSITSWRRGAKPRAIFATALAKLAAKASR